jgi:aminoacylase
MSTLPPTSNSSSPPLLSFDLSPSASISRFQKYLQCKTVHPDPTSGYLEAVKLFQDYAESLSLQFESYEFVPGHPTIILSWIGSNPSLQSIVLSGHMDVVPVEIDKWILSNPWSASIIDNKIYGRGTQDMKSVSIQYLEAIARLKLNTPSFIPLRTIHILLVPDEEVGGQRGMKALLASERINSLNPALVLDEGLASPSEKYSVFYGERKIWWVKITAIGSAGHGSRFIDNTAVCKLAKVLDKMLQYREEQKAELDIQCKCGKQLGDFTSINCTMLNAGVSDPTRAQYNVIPTEATAGFDIRIPATVNLSSFKEQLDTWCSMDTGVSWEPLQFCKDGLLLNPISDISNDSKWWKIFNQGLELTNVSLHEPSIFPAASDARWVRLMLNCPCFGFSPMRNTPILLHDHDEFIPIDVFLEGIDVYEKIIPVLANATE